MGFPNPNSDQSMIQEAADRTFSVELDVVLA